MSYKLRQLLCTRYQTPDDGQKTCPKHVEFYSKNKFEKFVHLVGFIIGTGSSIRLAFNNFGHMQRRITL